MNKKTKKLVLVLLASVFMVSLVAGCSTGKNPSPMFQEGYLSTIMLGDSLVSMNMWYTRKILPTR